MGNFFDFQFGNKSSSEGTIGTMGGEGTIRTIER